MGEASASSSASSAINSTGGNLTINKPNAWGWIVAGLAVLLAGIWFVKRRKR